MSVHVDPTGNLVITVRALDRPGSDLLALRTALIDMVECQRPDLADNFNQYRVLELLKDMELTDDQVNSIFE